MEHGNLLVVTGNEISELFKGKENEILNAVDKAYQCHGKGEDFLPHSIFLRFPDSEKNRIIGLPAYLGGEFKKSGMKWIASYPKNHDLGLDRASATIILNSYETGIPIAILEGSVISAKRTAASAALAAKKLANPDRTDSVSLIGCGLINFETLRFLKNVFPELNKVFIYDISQENAEKFKEKCEPNFEGIDFIIVNEIGSALQNSALISLATTSVKPHINDLNDCQQGATILHISLRDFTADATLSAINIVDDLDHVSRAQTSIHLAEQSTGNRDFVRCSLPEILLGKIDGRQDWNEKIIFSPFGLGILDIALSDLVFDIASKSNNGLTVESFLPDYWLERE